MEWVPIFYFRLYGEIGGRFHFSKRPVLYKVKACVGMPQLGHLLVRPSVLNISYILNDFDIISY